MPDVVLSEDARDQKPWEWPTIEIAEPKDGESRLSHTCEDGHHWTVQPDGGVSPDWGYGLTSATWPGYDNETCPEPERGHSRYTGDDGKPVGPFHGYKCPTCGTVNYTGSCHGPDNEYWKDECDPPPPACRKPPVKTARWMRVKRWLPVERKGKEAGTYDYKPRWTHDWIEVDRASGRIIDDDASQPSLF